jgi:hypothetical protein
MTADNAMKCDSVVAAIILASVVLPVPGGPQKIIECHRMRPSLLDGPHQWLAFLEQVALTGKLAKRGWSHAVG